MTTLAVILVNIIGLYMLVGLCFGIWFVFRGVHKIDPNVQGSSKLFRIMLVPGCVALWPLLLRKWSKAN